jgi:hypothetical protein
MTRDEATALRFKPGTVVKTKIGKEWVYAVVDGVPFLDPARPRSGYIVEIRRRGLQSDGRPYPRVLERRVHSLRIVPDLDPSAANIYADWLDDHGEHNAARMLREAFPLGPPAPVASTE